MSLRMRNVVNVNDLFVFIAVVKNQVTVVDDIFVKIAMMIVPFFKEKY
jgi:hypothetical protein